MGTHCGANILRHSVDEELIAKLSTRFVLFYVIAIFKIISCDLDFIVKLI
jgi:hypothetical protein